MTRGTLKSQYFRDKIEIFIRLFDEHFARHSHWRETWRHTGRRTVPQISLETPSPPHPPESEEKRGEMCRPVIMVAQFLDLKNLSCRGGHLHYRTMEEMYGLTFWEYWEARWFVPVCNHAHESNTCQFFSAIFAGLRIAEIQKFFNRGRGGWFLPRWVTLSARRCYLFP